MNVFELVIEFTDGIQEYTSNIMPTAILPFSVQPLRRTAFATPLHSFTQAKPDIRSLECREFSHTY